MIKTLKSYILDTQGQLTIVAGQVWPKINLIKAFIVVLDTRKNDEDPSRNDFFKALECSQHTPIIGLWRFFSDSQGQITPYTHVRSC